MFLFVWMVPDWRIIDSEFYNRLSTLVVCLGGGFKCFVTPACCDPERVGKSGFKCFFVHPCWWKWSNLTNIFQMGGSNTGRPALGKWKSKVCKWKNFRGSASDGKQHQVPPGVTCFPEVVDVDVNMVLNSKMHKSHIWCNVGISLYYSHSICTFFQQENIWSSNHGVHCIYLLDTPTSNPPNSSFLSGLVKTCRFAKLYYKNSRKTWDVIYGESGWDLFTTSIYSIKQLDLSAHTVDGWHPKQPPGM